jgi:O-succinylbenzoate synthase
MEGIAGDPLVYSIPMRTRFRGLTRREGMLWSGPAGWAEFSPFWDYPTALCQPWLQAAYEAAELGWPAPLRDRIPVNVTVAALAPQAAHDVVLASGGCRTAKVKVAEPGQRVEDDLARLAAVRDALGPGGAIRIDVNAAWDLETASRLLPRYAAAAGGLQYAEQPCAELADLAELRRRGDVPIAADESLRTAADPLGAGLAEAVDLVVVKVAPLGGVRRALSIAERVGRPVVVSSALETSVGLAAGLALAAALPELPYACGLATTALLCGDLVAEPLRPEDGMITVRRPVPVPERLAQFRADRRTTARWQERYRAVSRR